MATFLLVISLLLNGISIFLIIILYARQNRILEAEKTQEQFKKDMEVEISAFLLEMKEENETFIKRFQQVRKTVPAEDIRKDDRQRNEEFSTNGISGKIDDSDSKGWTIKADKAFQKQAVKAYQQIIANNKEEKNEAGQEQINEIPMVKSEQPVIEQGEIYRALMINQVKILQQQGLSTEEIAKKLNKGKTEIELMLKFG